MIQMDYYQQDERLQQESGQLLFDFDGDEIFHVDLQKTETIWRLPEFGKFASFEAQRGVQSITVLKQHLEVMMKRSNRSQGTIGNNPATARPAPSPLGTLPGPSLRPSRQRGAQRPVPLERVGSRAQPRAGARGLCGAQGQVHGAGSLSPARGEQPGQRRTALTPSPSPHSATRSDRVLRGPRGAGGPQRPDLLRGQVLAVRDLHHVAEERAGGDGRRLRDRFLSRPGQHLPQVLLPALHPHPGGLLRLPCGA